ncbi:O-antigen ligase family protein [Nocardioides oleivorans]|uniref:O-antigen ligase family protein n=1 Tax=Nocardioides oleivorans TaxID=273676 RepID=UPI0013EDD815|nr:O-antigen ligase family protein [Nocardioides oleivorans]
MSASDVARRALRGPKALLDWHDRRPRATLTSPRGWIWMALIAALLYWMSNPLVFIPSFFFSFEHAKFWTKIAILVTLPWLRLPRIPWPWLLFLGLCYLSQLWSISDANTDLTNLVTMQVALMALIVAANCEALVVCWGLGLGGIVVLALSAYAYEQELPGASNPYLTGSDFAGVGTNENILAYTLGVSLAAVLAIGWPRRTPWRVLSVATTAALLYGIYRAASGTGFLAVLGLAGMAALIAAWPRLTTLPRRVKVLGSLAVVVVPLVAGLVVSFALGKDLGTVSGRAPFWRAAVEASLETAPWFGSGWGAVWQHPWNAAQPNAVAQLIYDKAGYVLPHGHNYFVDVMPELGLVGVAIVVAMVVQAVTTARRTGVREGSDPVAGRLVVLVLVSLMVFGITEPMFSVPLGWWSLTLVVATARQRVLPRPERGARRWPWSRTTGRRRADVPPQAATVHG